MVYQYFPNCEGNPVAWGLVHSGPVARGRLTNHSKS